MTVAEYGGIKFDNMFDPHVVLRSCVQKRSFWAIGIPANEPEMGVLSKLFAFLRDSSSLRDINAFNAELFLMLKKVSCISSV
jgi:hypothetical protein